MNHIYHSLHNMSDIADKINPYDTCFANLVDILNKIELTDDEKEYILKRDETNIKYIMPIGESVIMQIRMIFSDKPYEICAKTSVYSRTNLMSSSDFDIWIIVPDLTTDKENEICKLCESIGFACADRTYDYMSLNKNVIVDDFKLDVEVKIRNAKNVGDIIKLHNTMETTDRSIQDKITILKNRTFLSKQNYMKVKMFVYNSFYHPNVLVY